MPIHDIAAILRSLGYPVHDGIRPSDEPMSAPYRKKAERATLAATAQLALDLTLTTPARAKDIALVVPGPPIDLPTSLSVCPPTFERRAYELRSRATHSLKRWRGSLDHLVMNAIHNPSIFSLPAEHLVALAADLRRSLNAGVHVHLDATPNQIIAGVEPRIRVYATFVSYGILHAVVEDRDRADLIVDVPRFAASFTVGLGTPSVRTVLLSPLACSAPTLPVLPSLLRKPSTSAGLAAPAARRSNG